MSVTESEVVTASQPSESLQPNSMHGLMQKLRLGQFSDFVIKCGDDEYKVHKAIVCSRSTFFGKACFGSFKEASQAFIDLKEDDPAAVKAMVEYFYLDNYNHLEYELCGDSIWTALGLEMIPLHARVYVLADKYDIPGLRDVAEANLDNTLREDPNLTRASHFRQAVRIIYEETMETASIRKSVVDIIVRNKGCVLQKQLRDLILDFPELSEEVIVAFGAVPSKTAAKFNAHCRNCGKELTGEKTLELVGHGDPSPATWDSNNSCLGRSRHSWFLREAQKAQFPSSSYSWWDSEPPRGW